MTAQPALTPAERIERAAAAQRLARYREAVRRANAAASRTVY